MLKLVNHRRRLGLWAGAILSLGLTLAAALTVFAALDAVMLRPLPYPAQEQLKRVLRAQGPERRPAGVWPGLSRYRGAANCLCRDQCL